MGALFSFSLYSGIILALLYLCYKWVLAGENQHWFNRIALWLIYTAALTALPAVALFSGMLSDNAVAIDMPMAIPELEIDDTPVTFEMTELPDIRQPFYLTAILGIYLAGMVIVMIHTLWIGIRLYRVIRQGEKREIEGYTLVLISDTSIAPFSWCRYVVMSRSDWEESGQMILTHELQHLRLCHWIDLLLAQAVGILQWYNPAAWLMREELKSVHEYQADYAVIDAGVNARDYQMLLIKKAVGARFPSLANSLNHSKLKKRITMMYNSKTSHLRRLRGLALVPACAVALFVTDIPAVAALLSDTSSAYIIPDTESTDEVTATDESVVIGYKNNENISDEQSAVKETSLEEAPAEASEETPKDDNRGSIIMVSEPELIAADQPSDAKAASDDDIYTICDEKPQFPGGEKSLMEYIANNVQYPKEAKDANIQGRVIVQFVVTKDGSIGQTKIIRGKNELLDQEAVRVIKSLPKFTPGKVDGKPVNVWYTLPISFKTMGNDNAKKPESTQATAPAAPVPAADSDDKVFDVVEQKPQFPGGERAMMEFVSNNLLYPKTAFDAKIQGRVIVQFVVRSNGSIGDVKVIRGKDPALDAEAVRVIKTLPAFTPGMLNGQAVNVWYTLPISFKVTDNTPKSNTEQQAATPATAKP